MSGKLVLALMSTLSEGLAPPTKSNFCVVGCGVPGRGMGWFHALQLFHGECNSGRLASVVEPWFLGGGKESPGGEAFQKEVVQQWAPAVKFDTSLKPELWETEGPKIALIAGRTVDNPKLFRAALDAGATHIMLEKPGAPTVGELEDMAVEANERGVPVFMGFIKQISAYVASAMACSGQVTFKSYNNYAETDLGECFERNAEGMLKNMAIHELALAVDLFDLTLDTLADVRVNDIDVRNIGGRTDFVKVDLTLYHTDGRSVTVYADRCAGVDGCEAVVTDSDGAVVEAFPMVDEDRAKQVDDLKKLHPDWLGYLLTQAPEYQKLKETCAAFALGTGDGAKVATMQTAIDSLKLAEHLTDRLLSAYTPSIPAASASSAAPATAR